jgi:hypothetical protein
MLPRQSKILDTDDTDDTDDTNSTDRNGQKSVSAARVYPCPMPWSDGGAASPGSSGAKTGFPATALRVASAVSRPSLLRMTRGRQNGTDTRSQDGTGPARGGPNMSQIIDGAINR